MSATHPLIRMEHVGKNFGLFKALHDFNLEVTKGERIVVCGPSGSGKSTMIRCINRLEKHDEGRIFIGDIELTDFHGFLRFLRVPAQAAAAFLPWHCDK